MAFLGALLSFIIIICLSPIIVAAMIFGGAGYWIGHFFSQGWSIFGAVLGGFIGLGILIQP